MKKLLLPVLVAMFVLAGCGPAASGSLGPAPSGTATRPAVTRATASTHLPASSPASTPAAPASSPVNSPAAPSPTTPSPTTPAAPRCSQVPVLGGTFKVCPGAAPVGATVTITSDTTCQAGPGSEPTLVFLGPKSYIGSGGGGNEVPITKTGKGFTASYRIPASYVSGGNHNRTLPVTPGTGYSFATYPAAGCDTPFTVTR